MGPEQAGDHSGQRREHDDADLRSTIPAPATTAGNPLHQGR
jgi:hypothetical protein